MSVNDPQEDLLDLITMEHETAVKEKRSAIRVDRSGRMLNGEERIDLVVSVSGHDLWNIGLNKDHDADMCAKCMKPYDLGYKHGHDDLMAACPYEEGTPEAEEYDKGFTEGCMA
jgi:hypothetical protein